MKINSVIREVLYEQKEKNLKIFYDVDIFLQEFPEKEEEPTEEPTEEPEEVEKTPEENTKTVAELITEAIYKTKATGELVVPASEAENIQSLQDLLDYVSDKKVNGKAVIDDVVIEIILALVDSGTKPLEELIDKGDKVRISLDYGKEKDNSIGFKVLKNAGTDTISITMKKDNKVLPADFQLPVFNQQLVLFRNSVV